MVVLDGTHCTGCGLCARVCHESCIRVENGLPTIDHGLCSTCTQCIAVCPQRALSWDSVLPSPYDQARLPRPEQLSELFRERRSIRFFRNERIGRTVLGEIVSLAVFSPTNNYSLRIVVADDPATIDLIDRTMLRYVRRIYSLIYNPRPVYWALKGTLNARGAGDKVKINIEQGLAAHGHSVHENTAAIVFLVGDGRVPLSIDSAQYALANIMYYAQSKGIGTYGMTPASDQLGWF